MKKKTLASYLLVFFTAGAIFLYADETEKAKKISRFHLGFVERIRQESSDNTASLNEGIADSSAYVRIRTSFSGLWQPNEKWQAYVRLTNENRFYIAPKSDPKLKKNWGLNEFFFDQLYVKWQNSSKLPLTVTIGRQDTQLGEGFLIMDGGPLDGSRSAYFNGLRLDWALKNKKSLTFFYFFQPRRDTLLPLINSVGQAMVEQPEQGVGFYLTTPIKKVILEAYLFRKDTFKSKAVSASFASASHVAGARVQVPLTAKLSLTSEGALQLGKYGEQASSGLGGYFHLDYKSGARFPIPAQVTLGGIYLSGDDPETNDRYEGWDPAFSRWPKWSESFIYLQAKETRVALWSNFTSLYAGLVFEIMEKVKLNLTWHHLGAPQNYGPVAICSGTGHSRGDLAIVKLSYDVNKNLAGHFIWESFHPGSFYLPAANSYTWVRFEFLFRY